MLDSEHQAWLCARKLSGGTTVSLSKAIKATRAQVEKWINRRSRPPYEFRRRAAGKFNLSLDILSPDTLEDNKDFVSPNKGKPIQVSVKEISVFSWSIRDCTTQDRPILISTDCKLMTGFTKFNAYQAAKAKTIPVIVIDLTSLKLGMQSLDDINPYLLFSERTAVGLCLKQLLPNRQGQRTDLIKPQNTDLKNPDKSPTLCLTCDKVRHRTEEFIAQTIGLGSKDTFRRAQEIVRDGILELITSVDCKQLLIAPAAEIASFPSEQQLHRLQLKLKGVKLS